MWLYKVCKHHKNSKTYTITGRFTSKKDAEYAAECQRFIDHHQHKITVKRFSGDEGDIF